MNDEPIILDFSKLKPNGYHYVAIGFALPYALHLPIDSYEVAIEINLKNQTGLINIQIITEDRWNNQDRGHRKFPLVELETPIEQRQDTSASYRYTGVWVFIPVGSADPGKHRDLDSIWKQVTRSESKDWYQDLALKSVNRLLEVYRYHTKESHVTPLAGKASQLDFIFALMYNEEPPQSHKSLFITKLMPHIYWGDLYPKLPDAPDEVVVKIRKELLTQFRVPLAEDLILNSYKYLSQGEYRLAIIEIETAFEAAINRHLLSHFANEPEALAEIQNSKNFTDLVKSRLCRKAFNGIKFTEQTDSFENWRQRVMNSRNALVHGEKESATIEEAIIAIDTVESTLALLTERPFTYKNRIQEAT